MRVLELAQGSPEWIAARLGKVTASRIADVCARTKSGYSSSRDNYAGELICERLTGRQYEKYVNAAMARGTEMEPKARELYEFMTDAKVTQIGLVLHPTIDMAAASPDGLVGEDGLIEIKCPGSAVHIETLLSDTIDGKYVKQMQWQMLCTNRKWCDFVSFDDRLAPEMSIFIKRVPRDNAVIQELESEVRSFLAEIDRKLEKLRAKFALEAA